MIVGEPVPRFSMTRFHAHAVVRARYACIPSSTMPAIRYSRNEILCLFCAMKKKTGGRRERERELYLLISSLPGGTVNDWLLSSFILLLFCFFLSFFRFLFISLFSFFSFFFFSWDGIANRQRALTLRLIRRKNSVGKLISVNLDTIQFGNEILFRRCIAIKRNRVPRVHGSC